MDLKAGNISDSKLGNSEWTRSMAKAIEDAFIAEWPNVVENQPAPTGDALLSLRLMFVAVAKGVVKHLVDNPDAFEVLSGGGNPHTHPTDIDGNYA